MATPAQRTNTWTLDEWYDQAVAGTQGSYSGEGRAFAWGMNNEGGLGANDKVQRSSPVQIAGTTWSKLSITDYNHGSFGLKTDGTLWSWGNNTDGMLGQGGTIPTEGSTSYSSPLQIGTDTNWSRIRSDGYGGMATKTDGTLWMWGKNGQGALGQNNRTAYSSPKQVPGTWSNNFECCSFLSLATKTDGTLWAWGRNNEGILGLNEPGSAPSSGFWKSSPTQIPGTTWSTTAGQLDAHPGGACCMKTDSTAWFWGRNTTSSKGPGGPNSISSPTQIDAPGSRTWSQICSGNYDSMGVTTDGKWWQWGAYNSSVTPQEIGSGYSECDMYRGQNTTKSGLKTDGSLYIKGENNYGQLGQNSTADSLATLVQIPGTWTQPVKGERSNGACQNV